ncbi:MAG: hypothetical protein ACI861_001342 [Paracoccaceae bacterium]|jgi:hypothetical protein
MRALLNRIPLIPLVIFALALGLAPFVPEPHLWQKVKMLIAGDLGKPLDIFDLVFHTLPWLLLGLKIGLANSDD